MLPNLTFTLIYSLIKHVLEDGFKDNCSQNTLIFAKKLSRIEFTVKEVTVCRVRSSLNKALHQIDFLGIQ